MALYDALGNLISSATFRPVATKAEPVTIEGGSFAPVPEHLVHRKGTKVSVKSVMTFIDGLAGGRDNFITVMVPNPKLANSIASRNWPLYGEQGKPTVTIREFIKAYPAKDGGTIRAENSLAWDLGRGYIKLGTGAKPIAAEPETETKLEQPAKATVDWSKMKA